MAGKDKAAEKSKKFNLLPKIVNGGIAGIVGVSVVFPLDLVKTRLQNQAVGPNGEKLQYKNMLDCFKKTYRAEGYFGMYRGSAVNIILITPEKAIKLASNDLFRYYLTLPDGSIPLLRQMMAGGMAGCCQIIVTTPMELLKIQMQDAGRLAAQAKAEGKTFQRTTALELTRKLLRERGIFGLYKGILPTAARDVSFSIVYFPLFATLNSWGPKEPGTDRTIFWWTTLCGCISGSVSALFCNPFDVVKTRMQTLTKGKGERQYTSIWDCVSSTYKREGPLAFFKGGACRMIVLAPLFGIAQTVYFLGIAERLLGYER